MTTPSGQISLNDVNVELGLAGTTTISMNQANVRTLAGVPSGAISMQNLQNKSNRVTLSYTYSSPAANAALNLSSLGGYVSGKSDITVTVNGGVYLYSTSTGSYGLNLSGSTTGDTVALVNNGFIMGQGGNGGNAWVPGPGNPSAGVPGGPSLNLGIGVSNITITNTSGYIGGGGGGGGSRDGLGSGGGGAGAGNGGSGGNSIPVAPGGTGGNIGAAGNNGNFGSSGKYSASSGGGGGRILPGTGGNGNAGPFGNPARGGGAGGGGGGLVTSNGGGMPGGSAGAVGNSPGQLGYESYGGGGGGGWGAAGGNCTVYGGLSGGNGGKAVNLNGKSITWTGGSASSSRAFGAVS